MSLRSQLIRDEGSRPTVYLDSKGIPTFGVGHNGNTPLSPVAISQILNDDIAHATVALMDDPDIHPVFVLLSLNRQNALINMAFTMGAEGVAKFKDMLAALKREDFVGAAAAVRSSLWAKEAPQRAERVALQIETDIEQ